MRPGSFYDILGVAEDDRPSVILAAYRRLAPKCHPDSTVYDPDTFPVKNLTQEQYWLAINEAIEVLTVPELRCRYNLLKTPYFEYVFSGKCLEIFAFHCIASRSLLLEPPAVSNGNQWIYRNLTTVLPVPVQRLNLLVTLEEMFNGTVKPIFYHRMRYIDGKSVTQLETLSVAVHPYMRQGWLITYKGYGHETELGQSDLVVELHQIPHPIFTVLGNDLMCCKALPLSTAMFGGILQVQTIDSKTVTTFLTPTLLSVQSQPIRFVGEGLHTPTGRGDLLVYCTATINNVPPHLWDAAQRTIREIEEYRNEEASEEQ